MAQIGEEHNFLELFTEERDWSLISSLKKRQIDSVLSIGCGDGEELVQMFHEFGASKLYGADAGAWENLHLDQRSPSRWVNPIALYKGLAAKPLKGESHDQVVHDRILKLSFEIESEFDVFTSPLLEDERTYDLIILSRVVHFMTPQQIEELFKRLPRIMHAMTVVYMRIDARIDIRIIAGDELIRQCNDFATSNKMQSFKHEEEGCYTYLSSI